MSRWLICDSDSAVQIDAQFAYSFGITRIFITLLLILCVV